VKAAYENGIFASSLVRIIKCLSKGHDPVTITLSASTSFLKMNKALLLPISRAFRSLPTCHNGVNARSTKSILMKRGVRKEATSILPSASSFDSSTTLCSSLLVSERFCQRPVKSSISIKRFLPRARNTQRNKLH
jgi:hypothetical protein